MLNGIEYFFANRKEAMKYILDSEAKELTADVHQHIYLFYENFFQNLFVLIEIIKRDDLEVFGLEKALRRYRFLARKHKI